MYIYEWDAWPGFTYNEKRISPLLETCHIEQGKLLSKMEQLGLSERQDKVISTLTSDIIKSSEIEGEILNKTQVRSSIARKLGIQTDGLCQSTRNIDVVVEMMLDATQNYDKPLTKKRLCGWQACLFPNSYSGIYKIDVGKYRKNPMQVVSGGVGKETVHYQAPSPEQVPLEMKKFLTWFNSSSDDGFIKSAVAHLWFVTIHPFDDGNGRIARAISDMLLCRSDKTSLRFYSMSNQIMTERKAYYEVLEQTQKGNLDITEWLEWFLKCILKAIETSLESSNAVLKKYAYLQSIEDIPLNERQRKMIARILDPSWFGVLNTSKWAKITKCSSDTALRDIKDLESKGILEMDATSGGRSTNYKISAKMR